ncbi:MAG TPA: helix-turn-helix domain-containing protein [Pseudonocardiaceae bacterium]|nr:helix-turn-helix domain-containing protein [Pseudonocardiaceae bacterium]
MTRDVRTYDHFCLVARALERVGDRWSLLVVRDLLTGPKRFTDLTARLGGITPKTLSQRLRELTDVGIVDVDRQPGRREVWYRLTPAGGELGPVVDALAWWGLRHAWRWPLPGEPLHVEHLLGAITQAMENATDDHEPARWRFRFPDGDYLMECDGERWSLRTAAPKATQAPQMTHATQPGWDITVTATVEAFRQFLFDRSESHQPTIDIVGDPVAVHRFDRLIHAFADTIDRP